MTKEKTGKTGIFLRLLRYLFRYWPLFLMAICLTLFANQLALMGPKFSGEAIDAIAAPGGVRFDVVRTNVVKMLACYVCSAAANYGLAVLMVRISQKIV